MLEATADVQSLFMEFKQEMSVDEIIQAGVEAWMQMPDEAKEKFKAEKPEAYAALMSMMKGEM
jgi:hypothetical protein